MVARRRFGQHFLHDPAIIGRIGAAIDPRPGEELLEWAGGLRWLASNADAEIIRARATDLGGHATLFRGRLPGVEAFSPLPAAVARLNARLRGEFDPSGIFNRGRMHAYAAR